jgi:hypothetical protein
MPKVDIDDPRQNAFVQDWLTSYHTHVRLIDPDAQEDFDIVYEKMIEAIQETYSPMPHNVRTADWDNEA